MLGRSVSIMKGFRERKNFVNLNLEYFISFSRTYMLKVFYLLFYMQNIFNSRARNCLLAICGVRRCISYFKGSGKGKKCSTHLFNASEGG